MAAIGLERGSASAVLLQRKGGQFALKRAATITLPANILHPSFDEQNIANADEMADALAELVASAGLPRQKRWSVALPESTTRAVIMTLEGKISSRSELEEILRWKIERGFGATFDELRVSRQRLPSDPSGRARYLAIGVHVRVLAEFEEVFSSLGWSTGLILPRHSGEERWLANSGNGNGAQGDSLLISTHSEGFTAVMLRGSQPLIVRSVMCDEDDRVDELYRLLLFYRDRVQGAGISERLQSGIDRFLVVGGGSSLDKLGEMINETLGTPARSLKASDVGLKLPSGDLSFDKIAAPAGLAALAWG